MPATGIILRASSIPPWRRATRASCRPVPPAQWPAPQDVPVERVLGLGTDEILSPGRHAEGPPRRGAAVRNHACLEHPAVNTTAGGAGRIGADLALLPGTARRGAPRPCSDRRKRVRGSGMVMSRPGAGQVGAGDGKIAAFEARRRRGGRSAHRWNVPSCPFLSTRLRCLYSSAPECAGRAAGKKPGRMPSSTPGWRRTCILCLARSSAPATRVQVRRAALSRIEAPKFPDDETTLHSARNALLRPPQPPIFPCSAGFPPASGRATAYGILRNQGVKIGKLDFGPYPGLNPA